LVIDPHGSIIADAGGHENVLSAEMDLAMMHAWRSQFPALHDAGMGQRDVTP
jgi:predicted amidohydrolase